MIQFIYFIVKFIVTYNVHMKSFKIELNRIKLNWIFDKDRLREVLKKYGVLLF